jgi:regulator of RNase E activity RraA
MPVHVGGLVVRTGDLLHGDANGVTNVPIDIADEAADIAAEFVSAERIVLDYVQGAGEKTPSGLADRRKEYGAFVEKLVLRIGRR